MYFVVLLLHILVVYASYYCTETGCSHLGVDGFLWSFLDNVLQVLEFRS